ncbi:MAG: hypothetical protein Q8920_02580 [Bacillota bacterium]|nr:hypothetical protein [Bacillota bacterium]
MDFVKIPNLPESNVSLVVIDGRTSPEAEVCLAQMGIKVIRTSRYPGVYDAIAFHPDIMLHHIGEKTIVYAPGTSPNLLEQLQGYGFELIEGSSCLTAQYPGDIAYNAARVGSFLIHNFKYTDRALLNLLEKENLTFINVKQGYTKCSVSVVNENSIITHDKGIAAAVEKYGINVLLLEEADEILLPGLDRGLIGGCGGLAAKNKWVVNGNLRLLKSHALIFSFLEARGIKPISLAKGSVIDIGSVLPLMSV